MKRKTKRTSKATSFGMSKSLAVKTAKSIAKTNKRRKIGVIPTKNKRHVVVVG